MTIFSDESVKTFTHATVIRYLENNFYLVKYHGGEYARVYSAETWTENNKVVIQNNQIVGASSGIGNAKIVKV